MIDEHRQKKERVREFQKDRIQKGQNEIDNLLPFAGAGGILILFSQPMWAPESVHNL